MLINLIISLFLTIIIELIISLILGIRKRNDIYVVILVNICTNPVIVYIANLISTECSELIYNIIVMIMEIVVVFAEYKMYKEYLKDYKKSPLLLSLVNNSISYLVGIIINFLK